MKKKTKFLPVVGIVIFVLLGLFIGCSEQIESPEGEIEV